MIGMAASPLSCTPRGKWGGVWGDSDLEVSRRSFEEGNNALLPGRGKQGELCGVWRGIAYCSDHGDTWRVYAAQRSCDRRECPLCAGPCPGGDSCPVGLGAHGGGEWAHREAGLAAARLEALRESLGVARGGIRQVVVSAPPDRYAERGEHRRIIAKVRARAIALCRRLSWGRGAWGSVVVHLWRGCEQDGYTEWGPHAHVLCGGIDVRKTAEVSRRSGWIVKQVSGPYGFQRLAGRQLVRHLAYELGHAAVVARGHALTWWGAAKTFEMPEELPPPMLCDKCEAPLRRWDSRWTVREGGSCASTFEGMTQPIVYITPHYDEG